MITSSMCASVYVRFSCTLFASKAFHRLFSLMPQRALTKEQLNHVQ